MSRRDRVLRQGRVCGVAAICLAGSSAWAAPSIELRGVAARVIVVPEARRDIAVTVTHVDPRLPIKVRRLGDRIYVTGDIGRRVRDCGGLGHRDGVAIWGRGSIPYAQLPALTIRTPLAVRLSVGDAVFGDVGPSDSLDFTNQGCGDWTVGEVRARMMIDQAGSGEIRAGRAGTADVSVIGAGALSAGAIRGSLTAISSGSGAISVAQVDGDLDARVGGSGDIDIAAGAVGAMTVSIAGSGAVRFRGVARSLRASIAGSGDVQVDRVTGAVSKQIFGAGRVRLGR